MMPYKFDVLVQGDPAKPPGPWRFCTNPQFRAKATTIQSLNQELVSTTIVTLTCNGMHCYVLGHLYCRSDATQMLVCLDLGSETHFGYSTVCQILLGLMRVCQVKSGWVGNSNQCQSHPVSDMMSHPVNLRNIINDLTHFSFPSTSDTSSPTVSLTSFSSELSGEVRFEMIFSMRKLTVQRAPSVPE